MAKSQTTALAAAVQAALPDTLDAIQVRDYFRQFHLPERLNLRIVFAWGSGRHEAVRRLVLDWLADEPPAACACTLWRPGPRRPHKGGAFAAPAESK